ncbi:MAG: glycosyltransferase family 39 protein [Candidatus Eremiobacteraeota bacterium]|nr:glycosyltransferase family 39 protein [Candidatus Eremiobacteraeota bacterium]
MDVSARPVAGLTRANLWYAAVAVVLLLGLALRLKGLHDPILDHPAWRQGDTASIARNFATLQFNPLYPQTNYDGPPPNYVELELQIVPLFAAALYKLFGVHEVFGRLITIGFSLGTVAVLAFFARWLFTSPSAGIAAALLFAIMPGSVYYGRSFTPDATMVFFLTAALYVCARLILGFEAMSWRRTIGATALLAAAYLAKPVALAGLLVVLALIFQRARAARDVPWGQIGTLVLVPLALLAFYDRAVSAHAEWHWASGITTLHVIPALKVALTSAGAFAIKWGQFHAVLSVLMRTMLGPMCSALAILGVLFSPSSTRCRTLLFAWLAAGLAYTYVVVTVERVDYYMFLLLPLAALFGAGFAARLIGAIRDSGLSPSIRYAAAAAALVLVAAGVGQNRVVAAPYYRYSKSVYRNAQTLNTTLAPGALVVMAHYDPSILYYIGRYGWEEDPYLWTPFDEQSAIAKGARYFIDIERNRFARNVELCAWMTRFPIVNTRAKWIVYRTDPALVLPQAESQWRSFRNAEKAGAARQWLDKRGLCRPASR